MYNVYVSSLSSGATGQDLVQIMSTPQALIISGSSMSGEEVAMLEAAKSAYPALKSNNPVPDDQNALEALNSGKYPLIVIFGGPGQNFVARELAGSPWLTNRKTFYGQMVVEYGKAPSGSTVVIFSDVRGYNNQPRASVQYSPLSLVLPKQYVPIAATGIAGGLIALMGFLEPFIESFLTEHGKKGQRISEKRKLEFFGIGVFEVFSLLVVAVILGAALSWQYFGLSIEFVLWIFLGSIVCIFAVLMHELAHRVVALIFKFKAEYRIWPAGAFITIFSSMLGNTFSTSGFLIEEIPEDAKKWKIALMKLAGPAMSTFLMLFFAFLNLFFPSTFLQFAYSACAVSAVADMLPFRGMDGEDIKNWSIFVWAFCFLIIGGSYLLVTFLL
ncbi:MAG: hypothetical protein QXH30_00695 [Candidatus Bilamarchaeaceae archaeon]